MLRNGRTKKTLVLTLVGGAMWVYLLGVIAIAQMSDNTEEIKLTPNAMSQIVGGAACRYCKKTNGKWDGGIVPSYGNCESNSDCSPKTVTWKDPTDYCKKVSKSQKRVCRTTGTPGSTTIKYKSYCSESDTCSIEETYREGRSSYCTDKASTCG